MIHSYPAPAKLNLFLHVTGRRADGRHLLQTVFRFIDRADTVHLTLRDDGRVVREGDLPDVPEDRDLAVRAARLLQAHAPAGAGVGIRVDKVLPMGGGLGGGSSDAATVLLALNRLWRVNLPRAELQVLGLQLGADVPVFVFGQTAFAEGVGEILRPLTVPAAWYVVLAPPVEVSTAAVFAAPELTRDTSAIRIPPFHTGMGRNDLQPVVVRRFPEVARHLEWLGRFGEARMTGSGACVFATFGTEAAARDVFARRPAAMQGFVAQGVDRHPLHDCCA